jgi:hypothetical protein
MIPTNLKIKVRVIAMAVSFSSIGSRHNSISTYFILFYLPSFALLEDRGFKFGSHARVGYQYERVLKDNHQEQRAFDRSRPEQQTDLKCVKPQDRK